MSGPVSFSLSFSICEWGRMWSPSAGVDGHLTICRDGGKIVHPSNLLSGLPPFSAKWIGVGKCKDKRKGL